MLDGDKRIDQLAYCFSYIANVTKDEAKAIIVETVTGKSILDENPTVMYEQQTENLYSIALELSEDSRYKDLSKLFTLDSIVQSTHLLTTHQD